MKVTERGQITIPKALRAKYGITSQSEIVISDATGVITVTPKADLAKFDAALKKWSGKGAGRLKELGFDSSDELIEALRGR